MTIRGAFSDFAALTLLPTFVRKQRRLEKTIASIGTAIADEKAVRKSIDALLLGAGLKNGEAVTCRGYDIVHRERAGQERLDQDELVALLVEGGVDEQFVRQSLALATGRGETVRFAEVLPSKGATVRAA